MRAFFHNWEALISPVLDMVGLFGNAVFFPPQKLPYEDHFEFCTKLRKRHFQFMEQITKKIVILSRGNSSRSLRNEHEMVEALRSSACQWSVRNLRPVSSPRWWTP